MKSIVGYRNAEAYDLSRFGNAQPTIGLNNAVKWDGIEELVFERIENIEIPSSFCHLFSEWHDRLIGFGVSTKFSDGKERSICFAQPGTETHWLAEKLDAGFDAIPILAEPTPAEWRQIHADPDESFLLMRISDRLIAINAKNAKAVIYRSNPILGDATLGEPRWLWGRGAIRFEGALIPIVNAVKSSWRTERWSKVAAAIIMPYQLQSGSIASWGAYLSEAPIMLRKQSIDELSDSGESVEFFNERNLLTLTSGKCFSSELNLR